MSLSSWSYLGGYFLMDQVEAHGDDGDSKENVNTAKNKFCISFFLKNG